MEFQEEMERRQLCVDYKFRKHIVEMQVFSAKNYAKANESCEEDR